MKIRAIAALLFILVSISAFGQKHVKITGYVRDADGSPLELVLVQIKNTLNGAMTNEKGYYSITTSPGDSVAVIFSCLGYNKAERILPSLQQDMRLNVQMNYTSIDPGGSCCCRYPLPNQYPSNHGCRPCQAPPRPCRRKH